MLSRVTNSPQKCNKIARIKCVIITFLSSSTALYVIYISGFAVPHCCWLYILYCFQCGPVFSEVAIYSNLVHCTCIL